MRGIILAMILLILSSKACVAQQKYKTTTGEVNINASTPLEDIDAWNREVNGIIDSETGNFAVVMLVKDFEFDRKLMQEHFNENYMESDKYPKAFFSGTIQNFSLSELKDTTFETQVVGKLTIHGVSRSITEKVWIKRKGKNVVLSSNFSVESEDYKIEVPKILFQKIAREVQIAINLDLQTNP